MDLNALKFQVFLKIGYPIQLQFNLYLSILSIDLKQLIIDYENLIKTHLKVMHFIQAI